jgi:6-phosphogluconolactonase
MPYYVYVSAAGDGKIGIWALDPDTGQLTWQQDVVLGGGPSPLAVHPDQRTLYAGLRSVNHLLSLRIDPTNGSLSPIRAIELQSDPCYLATDRSGRYLFSAYYRAGHVAVHPIEPDGAASLPPIEWRATAPCAHALQTNPTNRYAYVPHVAQSNAIHQFVFDAHTGHLVPNPVPRVVPEPGVGPRHYCFHPSLNVVYFDNEQGCSVTAYHLDPADGTLRPFQTLSTLPEGYTGRNTCAQIHITPQGSYLYAANRGHDSIACYAIDQETGALTSLGQQPAQATPRAFNVDPSGRFVLASGLGSGRLTVYRIEAERGTLEPLSEVPVGERPMWVTIIDLHA